MSSAALRPRGRRHEDRGAQAVEFALILPVLLALVLGIINFGYLFGQQLALNQAVREGARMAVVPTGSPAGSSVDELGEIRLFVRNSTGGLVDKDRVEVTVGPTLVTDGNAAGEGGCPQLKTGTPARSVGQPLTIKAAYEARLLVPTFIPGLNGPFNLTSEAVFRCEW